MKRLIRFEYHKLFQKKALWCFLTLCVVVHIFSLYYQLHESGETKYNLFELAEVYQQYDLSKCDSASLQEELFAMNQSFSTDGISEQGMKDYFMLGKLSQQVALLETYDTYLENVEIQAEQRLESSLFAQSGSFSYRNLQKTPQAYHHLHDVNIIPDFDGGVLLFAQNRLLDAFFIIIAFLIIIQIFVAERENGTWPLIKSMKLGHARLLSAKFITAFSGIIGMILFFYGLNYLILALSVGFGDTGRGIQSVDGYFSSVFPISVGQYMILLVVVKILGVLALSGFFAMLCLVVRGSVLSAMAGIGVFVVEFVLWYVIYENSYLGPLKYLNIIPLLLADTVIANYGNMNFFNYPISNMACWVIMLFLCFSIGLAFSYFLYHNENSLTLSRTLLRKRKTNVDAEVKATRKRTHTRGLWFFEVYKQMIVGRGALVFAVFLCVQIFMFFNTNYYIDSMEFYYRAYAVQVEGEFSEEKERYLEAEETAYQEREAERMAIMSRCANGEIDEMYRDMLLNQIPSNTTKHNALMQVTSEYNMIKELQESKAISMEYVYRTPWKKFFEDGAMKRYVLQLAITFLIMLLVLSSSGALEKTSSMDKLITISVAGKRGILSRKLALYLILATVVMLCAFLPGVVKIFHVYGVHGVSAPVASYFLENTFSIEITLGGLLLVLHLLFYALLLFMTTVTFLFSEKLGNRIAVLLTGTILFLIPALAVLLI